MNFHNLPELLFVNSKDRLTGSVSILKVQFYKLTLLLSHEIGNNVPVWWKSMENVSLMQE
jgi:hypothetical protein